MKILQSLFALILISGMAMISVQCKSKSANTSTESNQEKPCKVVFNFGSYGSGINEGKHSELLTMLNEKKLKYTETVKGREGEKEICIPLTELKGKDKDAFIEQLKKLEDKNTLVSLSVN
jgi:hypothetical protein